MPVDQSMLLQLSPIAMTKHGDVEIAYEAAGPATGEPLILIMGVGGQMLNWPEGFCMELIERGFKLARFDNRDSGLPTHLTAAGVPSRLSMLRRLLEAAPYLLEDMAGDAVAVLEALEWDAAHVVGLSMGGAIAQVLAIEHPDRVRSLTSIASNPYFRIGNSLAGPTWPLSWWARTVVGMVRIARMKVASTEDAARQARLFARICGSPRARPAEPFDDEGARLSYERGHDQDAWERQNAAVAASGDRRPRLAGVRAPTLVLHGQDDPLIRPRGARATAEAIPGARLVVYPAMGHELPPATVAPDRERDRIAEPPTG
jgi:pimeloyl-ACP methyl ester carboxylesterase